LKDVELIENLKIPKGTMYQWKQITNKNDWRAIVYNYFSLKSVEEVKPEIERIEKILKAREENKENKS
jgi:hypothetical protein